MATGGGGGQPVGMRRRQMQQPHQTLTPIPDAAHQETTVATTEARGGGATLDAALRVASRQSRKADATATEADTTAESASDPRDLRSQRGSACDDSGGDASGRQCDALRSDESRDEAVDEGRRVGHSLTPHQHPLHRLRIN